MAVVEVRRPPPCVGYMRLTGVMGGPCLRCGASQPEHAVRVEVQPTPLEVAKAALSTIAFQGLSICSDVARAALERIKELGG